MIILHAKQNRLLNQYKIAFELYHKNIFLFLYEI